MSEKMLDRYFELRSGADPEACFRAVCAYFGLDELAAAQLAEAIADRLISRLPFILSSKTSPLWRDGVSQIIQ